MQELQLDEIEAVNGGVWGYVALGVVIIAVGVGIYNGYKDAEAEAAKKSK